MGTGFTIDTPAHVAKYGISSVVSLVDDILLEQIRQYWCEQEGVKFEPVPRDHPDPRARRVTTYLDLIDRIVKRQFEEVKAQSFETGSDIVNFFEMLEDDNPDKLLYREMEACEDAERKAELQDQLRVTMSSGRIDVNIMAALDREYVRPDQKAAPFRCSDACAALRGFAQSTTRSAIVLSAGMNPRLYNYLPEFEGFFLDDNNEFKKLIVLKVSDYRSAMIQGRYLAKRGLWVSEFRIESGINCGGHAFPAQGELLGPILEDFKNQREKLHAQLLKTYRGALKKMDRPHEVDPPLAALTAQGGIGTAVEDRFLRDYYGVASTGWGTPFLLVSDATNVDDEHLKKVADAGPDDVYLSNSSPLGHPFWNLRNSSSEEMRRERIEQGKPGTVCLKGYSKLFNTEFTDVPICEASRDYQLRKLQELGDTECESQREHVMGKSCICHDLGGGVLRKLGIDQDTTPAICPGPGVADFSKIVSLQEMVDHIYGRANLITSQGRPHVFLREWALYNNWRTRLLAPPAKPEDQETAAALLKNLRQGLAYYFELADKIPESDRDAFKDELARLRDLLPPEAEKPAEAASAQDA
jgi:hypothetical protein